MPRTGCIVFYILGLVFSFLFLGITQTIEPPRPTPSISIATNTPRATRTMISVVTNTPRQTNTLFPTVTNTASPTHTPLPTQIPLPTATHTTRPTETSLPTAIPSVTTWYVNSTGGVNVRACPSTDCDILFRANNGDEISVVATNGDWHEILLANGSTAYIYAQYTSTWSPVTQPTSVPVQATQAPGQPTQVPQVQPTLPPVSGWNCDCSRLCSEMESCDEAYFQLQCGCSERDSDGDGVPCESICPGG